MSVYVTFQKFYSYAGEQYEINSRKSGCRTDILQRLIEQTNAMLSLYGRVLFVRVDLRMEAYTPKNEPISEFIKALRAYVSATYQTPHMGFVWAREQEKAKRQHYHIVLMLDGDVIRHPSALNAKVVELWERNGSISIPPNCYVFIDGDEDKQKAIWRGSYLAKPRGKGYQAAGARDFGCSRIKAASHR
ncbi:MAG: inovirus-type Gp2 protein [Aeromonas bestiarum]